MTFPRSFRRRDGQVLVIFAFGLVGILAVAALVFDVGQDLVERRTQQKAADAAALAGAEYLTLTNCKAVNNEAACAEAVEAAIELAAMNGYVDGGDIEVDVRIPPGPDSLFANARGYIQVSIASTREAFFAGIFGVVDRRVATTAVATNGSEVSVSHSFLALNETECGAGKFGGNASITVSGSIQVNSSCSSDALQGSGANVILHAPACYVVGGYAGHSRSDVNCSYPDSPPAQPIEGADPAPDPLRSLVGPTLSAAGVPAAVQITGTGTVTNCPDGLPEEETRAGTLENPKTCDLSARNSTVRIFPGVYFGGIKVQGNSSRPTTILMEPGIYYLAGGGFSVGGGGVTIRTVDTGGSDPGGGILLYNTDDPYYRTVCGNSTSPVAAGCIQPITLTGNAGVSAVIELRPYQDDPYRNLLIYQDRNATSQPTLKISGEGRSLLLSGTIYAPEAEVQLSGNGESITVQVIADTWFVQGNGTIDVTYDADAFVKLRGIGLVQ